MEIKFAFYKAFEAKGAGKDDWIIAEWTRGPYSHVEIIAPDDVMCSSSPRDGGVRCKKHVYDKSTWDYISIDVDQNGTDRYVKFCSETQGMKYDWLGILGFVLPIHDDPEKYFCSEWSTRAGIIMGIECLYTKEPSRISPNKLAKILLNAGYKLD